jgi:Ca2+-binding RTX toxin-like protein
MIGGAGNDVYRVESIGDIVTELAGGGTDTVEVALPGGSNPLVSTYSIAALTQIENLTYTGGLSSTAPAIRLPTSSPAATWTTL